jgi:hypothetical protein
MAIFHPWNIGKDDLSWKGMVAMKELKDYSKGEKTYFPVRMPQSMIEYLNKRYANLILDGKAMSKNSIILNWLIWGIESEKGQRGVL